LLAGRITQKIGAITIWIKKGKFADELPISREEEPDYTITSLRELLPILESLGKELTTFPCFGNISLRCHK